MSMHPDAYTKFMVMDNYLTEQECDFLVDLFDSTPFHTSNQNSTWANRVKWPKYPEELRKKLVEDRIALAEKVYGKKLEIDNLNITLWREGDLMHPHSDYGSNNEFPWREYASTIYLNDGYTGGEIYFPEWKMSHVPKKGQLVIFPGGEVKHGVTEIKSGRRLTSICWFKTSNSHK